MRLIAAFSMFALIVTSGTPALAKGPFGSIKIGQWTGGAYTDDKTDVLSHCAAGAPYLNGVNLIVSQNVSGQWTIALAHTSFNFKDGGVIPFDVIFDGQTQVRLFGAAPAPRILVAPIANIGVVRKSI
jgi:hypothetical protein